MSPRRAWREAALLLLAAVLFTLACTLFLQVLQAKRSPGVAPPWFLPLDDAYIFIRYAQQAARGRPFEWNTGEPSTGASSLLFTLALIPVHWFSGDLEVWSRWSRAVGVLSLWGLGLAAARLLRAGGLADPWPLAGAVAVVWSGPVGFGAVAGMESALNAALLVLACALWMERQRLPWKVLALLPLARPENLLLVLPASLLALRRRPRWIAGAIVLPGVALLLLNRTLTGEFQPSGSLAKSWLAAPFLSLPILLGQYLLDLKELVLPVYLGRRGAMLWPPVGILAGLTAGATLFVRRLRPFRLLAATWLLLVLLAPLSALLLWQQMRHHHAGLVCAWLLAIAGLAQGVDSRLGGHPRLRGLIVALVPASLLFTFPFWARETTRVASALYRTHAPAIAWLQSHERAKTLLVNDAGLFALAHDGPMVDLMGLGSVDLARAYRHGPGAEVEALARRRPLPEIAVVDPQLLRVPELLGEKLLPSTDETIVARVRRELLAGTEISGNGVDFAYLPDEQRAHVRWTLPPGTNHPSYALLRPDAGEWRLQGCRPLFGQVVLRLPKGARAAVLKVTRLTAGPGGVTMSVAGASPSSLPELTADRWQTFSASWNSRAPQLTIARTGPALPCVESVRFE